MYCTRRSGGGTHEIVQSVCGLGASGWHVTFRLEHRFGALGRALRVGRSLGGRSRCAGAGPHPYAIKLFRLPSMCYMVVAAVQCIFI